MADNDDLDALLDEAMDMVDEQERQHEEEVKQHEAKLEADLQKALDEQKGAGADGLNTDMVKMFQSLLGGEGAGALGDDASFDTFQRDVNQLIATLEGVGDLKDEDKTNLNRVKELMGVLESDDQDKAKELLEQMKCDPAVDLPGGDGAPGDVDAAFKNCMDALQQLSDSSVAVAADGSAASCTAAAAVASASTSTPEAVPENIASMLLTAILDPEFVEPIRVMRDAYEPYLTAKRDSLSEEEKARYQRQHAKTQEICEFLKVPVDKEDDARVTMLLELMHEFSELGEPPKDLPEYTPKKVGKEGELTAQTTEAS